MSIGNFELIIIFEFKRWKFCWIFHGLFIRIFGNLQFLTSHDKILELLSKNAKITVKSTRRLHWNKLQKVFVRNRQLHMNWILWTLMKISGVPLKWPSVEISKNLFSKTLKTWSSSAQKLESLNYWKKSQKLLWIFNKFKSHLNFYSKNANFNNQLSKEVSDTAWNKFSSSYI